ncbi:MAG TPA: hypothetical protein VFH31_04560 [Pyrinomonadaceae bacterium]|nr:hypothetical protein [Pyrinomonadaceae bacterium]
MFNRTFRGLVVLLLAIAFGLVLDASGLAQCSMCRASLAGSSDANFIRNFNLGVLVLLVPPVAIFCGFFIALRRHKGRK